MRGGSCSLSAADGRGLSPHGDIVAACSHALLGIVCVVVSEPVRRFEPSQPLSVTEVAPEETSDGQREWCFSVKGLDETVQAARFATRREAEKAHQRFKRAIELLGRPAA